MDLLDSLHARLVATVAAAGEDAFPAGLTVADLYQQLIPYRVVRGPLGLTELAEYEHAMLRLLSGERHYLEVIDPDVRIEIQRELASLNPILGIYRDYSSAAVRLLGAPGPVEETGAEGGGATSGAGGQRGGEPGEIAAAESQPTPSKARAAEDGGAGGGRTPEDRNHIPAAGDLPGTATPRLSGTTRSKAASRGEATGVGNLSAAPGSCPGCGNELPDLPDVRFCPFCGREQRPPPCSNCGAAMDPEWQFCTRCGTGRGAHAKTRSREG